MGVAERRERERAQRRAHIIDAAERVFFELGPVAATMDDVAREAELSKGTLYLYFKSKDDLYLAIASRGLSRLIEGAEQVVRADPDRERSGFELLTQITLANRRFATDNPQHLRTMLAWMASGFTASPETPGYSDYHALVSRLFHLIVAVVDRGKQDGSIRPQADSSRVVMHLWGGTTGMWLLRLNREQISQRLPFPCDFDQLVPSFVDILLDSIRSPRSES